MTDQQREDERPPSARDFGFVRTETRRTDCYNGCMIPKNELKMRMLVGEFNGHYNYRHYCMKCARKVLDERIQELIIMLAYANRHFSSSLFEENIEEGGTNNGN